MGIVARRFAALRLLVVVGAVLSLSAACQTTSLASLPTSTNKSGAHSRGLLFGGSDEAQMSWPLSGPLSSLYGSRHGRFHHGIDIRVKSGSPVVAAAPGIVEFVGWQHGFGRVVIVRHRGFKTLYAHLSRASVSIGAAVDRTSRLGSSGQSGNSTGPHLHFEVRTLKGESIDPLSVLAKDKLLSSRS